MTTAFTELLCFAYDLNRGDPPDLDARVTHEEFIAFVEQHSIEHPPPFPTEAAAFDLCRTFGEQDGKALLVWASQRWDKKPLTAEQVDGWWWYDDHEPVAWSDIVLADELQPFLDKVRLASIRCNMMRDARDTLIDRLMEESGEADFTDAQQAEIDAASARVREAESEFLKMTAIAAAIEEPRMSVPGPSNVPLPPAAPLPDLIKTSAEFVHGFIPPDYLVDGVLQRQFCYSITAQTGVGKTTVAMLIMAHVSTGRALGTLDVAKGSVLYFAGENPTDIQMRWLGLTQELKIDPASADVHFVAGAMPLSQVAERITQEVTRKGLRLALVVVDTAAAYFEGDDENSNAQAVDHAKRMRSLTALPGGPTVLVLCHPTKRAADDDLIPRGGGAFLAEVDGNIALQKRETLIVASAQGKFRGREFPQINFELRVVHHPTLKDARGRDIPTVIAVPTSDAGQAYIEAVARRDEDSLLRVIDKHPGASLRVLAAALGWGHPQKVQRAGKVLEKEKLIRKHRGAWQLTSAGEKELNRLDMVQLRVDSAPVTPPIPGVTPTPILPPIRPR